MLIFKNGNEFVSKNHIFFITMTLIMCMALGAVSEAQIGPQMKPTGKITSIRILGLDRTKRHIINRELLLKKGDPVDEEKLQESLQRLRNLQIISEAKGRFVPTPEIGEMTLEVVIVESFSTVPLVNFGGDAGTNYYGAGIIDFNVFGNYLEVGAIYINYGGRDSGYLWYRDRRFLGERQTLGFDLNKDVKTRRLFNENGKVSGGYTKVKDEFRTIYKKEINPWFTLGSELEYRYSHAISDNISESLERENENNNFYINESLNQWLIWLTAKVGRLDRESERQKGSITELKVGTSAVVKPVAPHTDLSLEHKTFILLPHRSNLGFRAMYLSTDTREFVNNIHVGGIESVRGYRDGRFFGRRFFYGSLEYRIPSYVGEHVIVQHAGYVDSGRLVERPEAVFNDTEEFFSSVGVGLRFISPKIYILAARIDYSVTLHDLEDQSISFGLQQFF